MFSRIFHLPKKEEKKEQPCEWHVNLDDFQAAPRLPKIGKSNIRVLVFKDCDRKGKSLVFDSDAVVEVKEDEELSPKLARNIQNAQKTHSPCSSSRSLPAKYKFLKPKSDIKILGEMIFGSVTMTYRGSLVRVHHIRTPPQLLLSKVFAMRTRSSGQGACDSNTSNFNQSDSMIDHGRSFSSDSIAIPVMSSSPNRSLPESVLMPGTRPQSLMYSRSNLSLASNYSLESMNISGSMTSLHSPTPSPCNSLNRRWQRSQMTRLENYQHSKLKSENTEEVQTVFRKQQKIGIGVIFNLWETHEEKNRVFQNFLFSHYALFEGHLQKLRLSIERSFHAKKNFYVAVIEAIETFKANVMSFYSAPRLLEPVWLNMMNIRDKQEEIAERFINVLNKAMNIFETKEQSYFLSSLLTAVLTHHLAWVPTVMPGGCAPNRTYLDKHSSKTLDVLAKCHPYNPLWAQLGDLYGTVGYPPKITKTIVVGKDPTLVRQILYILSYFIRCSDIKEYSLKMQFDTTFDSFSLRSSDKLSSYSKTPTNTPNIGNWEEDVDRGMEIGKGDLGKESEKEHTDANRAFDDHEEICDCMCSVLQSIDYIGGKGLRNLKKFTNVIKSENSKQIEIDKIKENNGATHSSSNIFSSKLDDHKEFGKADFRNFQKNPTFRCYCCPDKHQSKSYVDNADRLRRQIIDHSEGAVNDIEAKSCYCGDRETSEYGSETVSNQCTLSRHSSCASCLDFFKRYEVRSQDEIRSQDLDSDYSSIANDEHLNVMESNGIELDLHDIALDVDQNDTTSENLEDEEFLSMNLMELPFPSSEIKPLPKRHFDHKVELPNFGRSLLAGYCDKFVPDFALHGVRAIDMKAIEKDLHLSVKHSVLDETVADAAYIIADVDTRKCQLVSLSKSKNSYAAIGSDSIVKTEIVGATVVSELLESLRGLWDLNIPYQFCLMHLEDRLKDIYSKSKVLAEYVKMYSDSITKKDVQEKMRLCESDLDLMIATGSTHCPYLQQVIE